MKKITSFRASKRKIKKKPTCELFKEDHPEERVPGCGGLQLDSPLPDHILPPEVLLVNPMQEEIIVGGARMIFLNTPLTAEETSMLQALETEIQQDGKKVPKAMEIQRLRLLQQSKNNVRKAVAQLENNFAFRMKNLPLREADILVDLQKGGMYWGGRDFRCRPSLIIRAGRLDKDLMNDAERTTRLAVFLLEYMIRYGMCPGRVENWGVIVDLDNAGAHGVPPVSTINSLVTTLQGIYRYRMVWTKIVNAPWWFTGIWTGIKRVVPGESVKKVEILGSNMANLAALFEPAQLEQRYGGGAPNLDAPSDFFPRKFMPGPFAPAQRATGSLAGDRVLRLHEFTSSEFHEGAEWRSETKHLWLPRAARSLLTPQSASHVKATCGKDVAATETLEQALLILQPAPTPPPEKIDEEPTNGAEGAESAGDGAAAAAAAAAVPAALAPAPPERSRDSERSSTACEVPAQSPMPEAPAAATPTLDASQAAVEAAARREGQPEDGVFEGQRTMSPPRDRVAEVNDVISTGVKAEEAVQPTLDGASAPPTRGWCCSCRAAPAPRSS